MREEERLITIMYSDNGTNFVGASRILNKEEYQSALNTINQDFMNDISQMGVTWHFNPPKNPSAGCLWEACVKRVKFHLKRIIGVQKLSYEEFYTILTQIEACLNSRPLCAMTENIEDGILRPGHILVGDPLVCAPLSDINTDQPAHTRWLLIDKMHKSFWKKWSLEYLQQLQARQKWKHPTKHLEINDIVLVQEDYMPPSKWALDRVQEVQPGKDGYVRVVTLKTANGLTKRPVTKLTLLPVQEKSNEKAS